jgi:YggT family protein
MIFIIDKIFEFIYIALMIRILLSWIQHDQYNKAVQILYKITDPILKPFQNLLPAHKIGIDLSPLFAFMALGFAKQLLFRLIYFISN